MPRRLLFAQPTPHTEKTADGYLLSWQGVAIMGILNLTPDSFSDGGQYTNPEEALQRARTMLQEGAHMIDVGGESTRPGAEPVSVEEELERTLPVIRCLAQENQAIISIDTRKVEVAAAALDAGAHLINDIGGLQDPEMMALAAVRGVPTIIMHMQGEPKTMQQRPHYDNVNREVYRFLLRQAELATQAGVPSVVLDLGFGFGKRVEDNLSLLKNVGSLVRHGYPVLIGASRKGTIDTLAGVPEPQARDPGTLALHLYAASQGVAMVRVHNVAAHRQAFDVWQALTGNMRLADDG